MKRCSACKRDRPLSDFGCDRSAPDGLQTRCKQCAREASRASRERHPERVRSAAREHVQPKRAADPEGEKAADAAYYQAHREEKQAWQRASTQRTSASTG